MEALLADELNALGVQHVKATVAGVAFQGDLEAAYRVCLWSRIASRVLLVLDTFTVNSQQDLYAGVQKTDWSRHLNADDSLAVTFTVKNSPAINNSHFGALKVKDAIVDQLRARFGTRPSIDTEMPSIRVNVHVVDDTARLALDLSGSSLHRRGYRDVTVKAPIKENLAAAILMRGGWPAIAARGGALVDPMCGSGTLLLEAAMIAADYAPGLLRDYFGFIGWKQHDAACWQRLRADAQRRKQAGLRRLPAITGFDQDRRSVQAALGHITRAGLQGKIQVERRDMADAAPSADWPAGLVVCNPPYGERLGDAEQAAELYKRFGEVLKARFQGWKAALIIGDPELGFRLGIRSQKPVTLYNGALECKLLRLDIVDSAFFVPKAKTAEERVAQVTANSAHDDADVVMFANRLAKNLKKLSKWAAQRRISCYRVYDADLPEYSAAIDLYQGEQRWAVVQEYAPPKTIAPAKANQRLAGLMAEAPAVLGLARDHVFLKIRQRQRSADQYEKQGDSGHFHVIEEDGCRLLVNFEDYLDTGLFLDHRPMRGLIQRAALGKRFLNLFAYTGAATVHAAVGGAASTTTVDMSHTYLNWAKNNLALNNVAGQHTFIQADCVEWLAKEAGHPYCRQFDLIFLDPPTFSNSKRMDAVFDVQTDHVRLIHQAARLLAPGGVLYFSTNFRRFKLDGDALSDLHIDDISAATIPEDFARNARIHYCWKIVHHAQR